jgi:hypothetical protein
LLRSQYWSEAPFPDVQDATQYAATLTLLRDLQKRFETISSHLLADTSASSTSAEGDDVSHLLAALVRPASPFLAPLLSLNGLGTDLSLVVFCFGSLGGGGNQRTF